MAGLRLDVVRDAVGPEMAVIIEETGGVVGDWVRDSVLGQGFGIVEESAGLLGGRARDDIALGRVPP